MVVFFFCCFVHFSCLFRFGICSFIPFLCFCFVLCIIVASKAATFVFHRQGLAAPKKAPTCMATRGSAPGCHVVGKRYHRRWRCAVRLQFVESAGRRRHERFGLTACRQTPPTLSTRRIRLEGNTQISSLGEVQRRIEPLIFPLLLSSLLSVHRWMCACSIRPER